ncbi:MAG: hypothetical protein K0B87_07705 [Candidatus Syntrophosphaera sp.]|nr:hypothetical protein [Candidatus Syntrophosphaera sp.]
MKKDKHLREPESPAPWPENQAPEPEPEAPRKKKTFGSVLLTILLFIVLIGIVLLILPWEKVANYTPDQWFKRELRLNAGLPQREKDAVNALYNELSATLGHDQPDAVPDLKKIDPYDYLPNMRPELKKYSRISLLKMLEALKKDIAESGIFVKRDFFLTNLPDADILQWEVQYTRSSDLETPSHLFVVRIRNSTGAAISRVLAEIHIPADSGLESTLGESSEFRETFTLLPAERNSAPAVETFSCPIRKDQFDLLNGRPGTATLKKVFLEELQY